MDDIEEKIRRDIKEAEAKLEKAEEILKKLRKTGEDITELERKYREAQIKIRNYKRAFGVE